MGRSHNMPRSMCSLARGMMVKLPQGMETPGARSPENVPSQGAEERVRRSQADARNAPGEHCKTELTMFHATGNLTEMTGTQNGHRDLR